MARWAMFYATLVFLTASVSGCARKVMQDPDPLIENIVRSADAAPVSRVELLDIVATADVVYLGEKHDNPRHHEIQAEIIMGLLDRGRKPLIAFEFFPAVQTGFVLNYLRKKAAPTMHRKIKSPEDTLRDQLARGSVQSTNFAPYLALLRLARESDLQAYGIDLPAAVRLRLARVGREGLSKVERRLLYPTRARDKAYRELMLGKLGAAHCGYGSEPYLNRLYETWVARNDAMAAILGELIDDAAGQPVVVILGAGHVQHNAGVYAQVAANHPESTQVNIGFREVSAAPSRLSDYLAFPTVGGVRFGPDHEYLWLTSRVDSGDPCGGLGRHDAKTKSTP